MSVAALLVAGFSVAWAVNEDGAATWPLARGNYWIYEGDIKWVEENGSTHKNEVRSKKMTWRSEVVDVFETREGTLWLLRGFPTDLAWYTSGDKPQDRLLLRSGTDYYQIAGEKAAELFQKIRSKPEVLRQAGDDAPGQVEAALLLPMPLAEGKRFGAGTTLGELFSSRYCYVVESVTPFAEKSVRNCPRLVDPKCYSITSSTNPDHSVLSFVPGLGITHYAYSHHGTTMEVDVVLVEFGQKP
ncbi:MAG: hypothetical protein ACAI35_15335 [Candidatus Methylacidiphilales bacterium]|nr:hypothetical protein [Candidatus Methylacidiphilales bacterium]